MKFSIEKASVKDIQSILQMEKLCFGDDAWSFLDIIQTLAAPNTVRFRAMVDGVFAGFAAAEYRKSEGIAWLTTISTLPDYRKGGIGRALLDACESAWPAKTWRLCADISNDAAISLYRKSGYQDVEIWKNYYESGKDALVMEKPPLEIALTQSVK